MPLNDILSEVAVRLGLKDTPLDALKEKQDALVESIRGNNDKLNELNKEIDALDRELVSLKQGYDNAGPVRKKLIEQQFKSAFARQDRMIQLIEAIGNRIRVDELLKDKIGLLIFAEEHPSQTELIDKLTLDMEGWLDEQDEQSKAAVELDKVRYSEKTGDMPEIESPLAQLSKDDTKAQNRIDPVLAERIAQIEL